MAGIFYLTGLDYGNNLPPLLLGMTTMLVPGLVAITIDKRAGKKLKESLWLRFKLNRWWLVALFSPIVLSLLAILLSLAIPGIGFDLEMSGFIAQLSTEGLSEAEIAQVQGVFEKIPPAVYFVILLIQALIAGATINAVLGLGEELGWRGLMLRELSHLGFWNSTTIIGAVWGIWHAPLILMGHNYPEYPVIGVGMMVLFCLALSPLFSLITIRCRSTIAAAITHGVLNASAALSIVYLDKTIPLITGLHGLIGIVMLMVINLGIFFFIRPTLSVQDWAPEAAADQ